ncbi:MAG: hypothetical protein AMS22_10415 [Thiotrichales bacterium SG8_50]|nr:MAG: hypothetical protein AMS22_10415 [Thiotrichales bacterium SG8_50]
MSDQDLFDRKYTGDGPSTSAPEQKSQLKQFLKQPLEQPELQRYGTSKPVRVIIRAKLINGKS